MVSVSECFSESYAEARPKVLRRRGGRRRRAALLVQSPWSQPRWRLLYLDTARLGPLDAANMLVLISSTHGVEGHCGSGAQIAWLRTGGPAKLPKDTGAGPRHQPLRLRLDPPGQRGQCRPQPQLRRSRQGLSAERGLRGHRQGGPAQGVERAAETEAERTFQAFAQKHGAFGLQSALSGGQYSHPDGIFFGGSKPTWSNRTVRAIAREELSRARRVGIIDFHTGLGPFGHGELICAVPPSSKSFARAKAWYGDEMTSPESGTSTSAVVVGVMTDAFPQELPDAEVTSIALEYGTYTVPEVLGAVRADNWLHHRGDLKSALGRELKADMKERFFPAGDKWREMVWARADQTIGWALKG